MRLIDSHCHLIYDSLRDNLPDVFARAKNANIVGMINICTKLDEFPQVYEIANDHEHVYATTGIHPSDSKEQIDKHGLDNIMTQIDQHCREHSKIVAIGETGLDYYYEHSDKNSQRKSFEMQLQLCLKYDLPVVVHTRNADDDTIDILKSFDGIRGVLHCFSSSRQLAYKALDLGFYVSVSGITTFKNAQDLRDIIYDIPTKHLLIETDAPYLAPVPKRGKPNEPSYMSHTFDALCELKQMDPEQLAQQLYDNTLLLFNKMKL